MHEVGGEPTDRGGPFRLGQDIPPDFCQPRDGLLVRQARSDESAERNRHALTLTQPSATVKKHLEHVYAKLGVGRRAAGEVTPA
jgi:hypothetical protein